MKHQTIGLLTSLLFSSSIFAQDFEFSGEIHQSVPQKSISIKGQRHHVIEPKNAQTPDTVTVLKMQLSDRAWEKINENASDASSSFEDSNGKNNIQLGMNNVPVLDQGPHGTCVTFSATAAIDAVLNKGDYISQLCQLQLGSYLEKNGYTYSGWDGSFALIVLNQMQSFGIVTKETQAQIGCAGYKEYPSYTSSEPTDSLPLVDYHQISLPLSTQVGWTSIIDYYTSFNEEVAPEKTLEQVKNALQSGDRLIFGTLLFRMDLGVAGAVGQYRTANDTWILTSEIKKAIEDKDDQVGGHEMIITGYNDDAVVTDSHGQPHKGLLTLRNSWGSKRGHNGTFYMSYDYFKALAIEVTRIRKLGE